MPGIGWHLCVGYMEELGPVSCRVSDNIARSQLVSDGSSYCWWALGVAAARSSYIARRRQYCWWASSTGRVSNRGGRARIACTPVQCILKPLLWIWTKCECIRIESCTKLDLKAVNLTKTIFKWTNAVTKNTEVVNPNISILG